MDDPREHDTLARTHQTLVVVHLDCRQNTYVLPRRLYAALKAANPVVMVRAGVPIAWNALELSASCEYYTVMMASADRTIVPWFVETLLAARSLAHATHVRLTCRAVVHVRQNIAEWCVRDATVIVPRAIWDKLTGVVEFAEHYLRTFVVDDEPRATAEIAARLTALGMADSTPFRSMFEVVDDYVSVEKSASLHTATVEYWGDNRWIRDRLLVD